MKRQGKVLWTLLNKGGRKGGDELIPLYKPHMPSLPELNDILNSGQLAAGNYTKKFENDLYMFFAEKNVLTVNTFNSAVSIAASCAGCKYGDEIVVSPMACLASTQPYAAAGLKIVWADIDPHTGTLDPESVEKKISRNTTCIIHNHFCGYPGYIDEINEIGKKYAEAFEILRMEMAFDKDMSL